MSNANLKERKIGVFEKGEYVVAGGKGVCQVIDVTILELPGVDKNRSYYILKPVHITGSTVYIPVDAAENSMRRILTEEEAEKLIADIPEIPSIAIENDKLLEQEYKGCAKANSCEGWVKIIKTIYLRKKKREEAGRKVTAVDAKYSRIAEDNLYGELSVVLKIPKNEVEGYIADKMHDIGKNTLHL